MSDKTVDTSKLRKIRDKKKRNILFVGPTQQGKSTLCSFLLLPEGIELDASKNARFEIGDESTSKTTSVSSIGRKFSVLRVKEERRESNIQIIPGKNLEKDYNEYIFNVSITDTPGIGDTNDDDEKQMIGFYQHLRRMKTRGEEIAGIVLVVKYGSVIDEQYRKNINFYKRLFPRVLERNVVLVCTNAANTPKWRRKKKKRGSDVDIVFKKYQTAISHTLGLSYDIPLFALDCYAEKEDTEDWENALAVKKRVLSKFVGVKPVSIESLLLPKTPKMIENDVKIAGKLLGKQSGLQKGIELGEKQLGEESRRVLEKQKEIEVLETEISDLETYIEDKNTEEMVVIFDPHDAKDTWKIFRRPSSGFEINTDYEIKDVEIAGDGWISTYSINEEKHKKGIIKSGFWQGALDVTYSAYTWSKIRHHDEIVTKEAVLELKKKEEVGKNLELGEIEGKNDGLTFKLNSFRKKLKDYGEKIAVLKGMYLNLDDIDGVKKRRIVDTEMESSEEEEEDKIVI